MSRKKFVTSKELSDRIVFLMRSLGYKKRQHYKFAEDIGVSSGYLSEIINLKTGPSFNMILGIAKKFPGIDFQWLLNGDSSSSVDYDRAGPDEVEHKKDGAIEVERKLSDIEMRLAAIEEAIKKSALYNKDGIEDETDLIQQFRTENENIKTDNKHLKFMVRAASQDFKDLIASLNQIFERHLPPDTIGERRACMAEIENLLTGTQSKIKNVDLREE